MNTNSSSESLRREQENFVLACLMAVSVVITFGALAVNYTVEQLQGVWSSLPTIDWHWPNITIPIAIPTAPVVENPKPTPARPIPTSPLGSRPPERSRVLSHDDLERSIRASVIEIVHEVSKEGYHQGSAVAIAPTVLLSVCHVGQTVAARWYGEPVQLKLALAHALADQCAFSADRTMRDFVLGIRRVETLEPGEPLYAYGYRSDAPTFSEGKFLEIGIDEDHARVISTDASIGPGHSGGGLFDRFGNLVGILKAVDTHRGVGFALVAEDWWEER